MAWTGTAHGLIAELGVGTVTGSALLLGLGLVWATRAQEERVPAALRRMAPIPA